MPPWLLSRLFRCPNEPFGVAFLPLGDLPAPSGPRCEALGKVLSSPGEERFSPRPSMALSGSRGPLYQGLRGLRSAGRCVVELLPPSVSRFCSSRLPRPGRKSLTGVYALFSIASAPTRPAGCAPTARGCAPMLERFAAPRHSLPRPIVVTRGAGVRSVCS